MPQALPITRQVAVAVSLTAAGAQAQSINSLLILGSSTIIDPVERYRDYSSLVGVANDFGTAAAEYLAASLWFQQAPQPSTLKIGRWVATAASGVLRGAPLSAAQQLLSVFTAINSGGFTYTKNGAAPTTIVGLNFSAQTNLNGVASIITAATAGAVCVWNASFSRFEITSTTAGPTSSISFLTAPGSATDVSGTLGMLATSSGAYRADGVAAESAVAAVALFDSSYGQSWYAVVVLGSVNTDHLAIAAFVEATTTKHVYGVTSQEAAALVPSATSDIAFQLAQSRYDKTMVQYSSSNPYAVVSLLGRILTVDYTGNNTTITLAYKNEPGVVSESLNTSQADSLKFKKCNAFLAFNNNTAIILNGVSTSGNFIDTVTGVDWLALTIQTALYNLLYTSTTKIPQTDAGNQLMLTSIEAVCAQGVVNGLLAPGVWNSGGFGQLKQGDYMPKGYYAYAPKASTQDPALRAARKSVAFQVVAKLAGAIHEVSLGVTVNQ